MLISQAPLNLVTTEGHALLGPAEIAFSSKLPGFHASFVDPPSAKRSRMLWEYAREAVDGEWILAYLVLARSNIFLEVLMNSPAEILKSMLFGSFLFVCPTHSWSQVYTEANKHTLVYPITGGWNMLSQDYKRQYIGASALPAGVVIENFIGANIQIKNDLNGSGVSTISSSLYRLNDQFHGTIKHGGQFHMKCDNYPQCEAYMYSFKFVHPAVPKYSFFTNPDYDSDSDPRGFVKLEYMSAATNWNPSQANDYYFPIGGWNMHTDLDQSKTLSVPMAGINFNNIASVSATVYSDPVNNKIEVRNFEQRGIASAPAPLPPGPIWRGGLLHVSNAGPTAILKAIGTHSNFSQENGNYNSSMFSRGGYTQEGSNRGWIKVTLSGSSDAKQPYGIKSKFMKIGGWPIRTDNVTAQPYKGLTFSDFGVAANRIVHAEALIISDPDLGSSVQTRRFTNLMRLNLSGMNNIDPDGGLFIIREQADKIDLIAKGTEGSAHLFGTNHVRSDINRGWFLIDYLAAKCDEGSGYTRRYFGFTKTADDCHGNNGTGSSAVHVIQTQAADLWDNTDRIAFIHKPQTAANFIMEARVDKIENTNVWARAGVMIRADADQNTGANSQHVSLVVTPKDASGNTNGISLTVRSSDGGTTTEASPNSFSAPYWVRVVKTGNSFSGYASPDGNTWTQIGSAVNMVFPSNGSTYYAGLVQTAGNNTPPRFNTSVYSNVMDGLPVSGSYYRVISKRSSKALEISGMSTANGGNAAQWTYGGGNNQIWQFFDLGNGYWRISNKHSGKALEVAGSSTANGANVQQWTYGGGYNQQWQLTVLSDGSYRITPRHSSSQALEVAGNSTANGANVQQWTYGGGDNQRWYISGP